jgi:hypothetical protein
MQRLRHATTAQYRWLPFQGAVHLFGRLNDSPTRGRAAGAAALLAISLLSGCGGHSSGSDAHPASTPVASVAGAVLRLDHVLLVIRSVSSVLAVSTNRSA